MIHSSIAFQEHVTEKGHPRKSKRKQFALVCDPSFFLLFSAADTIGVIPTPPEMEVTSKKN